MRKMEIPAKSHLRIGREISRATNDVIARLHSTGLLATLKCNLSARSKQEKISDRWIVSGSSVDVSKINDHAHNDQHTTQAMTFLAKQCSVKTKQSQVAKQCSVKTKQSQVAKQSPGL